MKTEYDLQAEKFLNDTNTIVKIEYLKHGKHFADDKESRDIYNIVITRGQRSFTFDFGQSLNNSNQWTAITAYAKSLAKGKSIRGDNKTKALLKAGISPYSLIDNDFIKNKDFAPPTSYDILTCLTKYDVGTLNDFCGDFGYDTDSKKAEEIYKAVLNEFQNVCMLWNGDEINNLQEIQ